jgi:hypothetical protein
LVSIANVVSDNRSIAETTIKTISGNGDTTNGSASGFVLHFPLQRAIRGSAYVYAPVVKYMTPFTTTRLLSNVAVSGTGYEQTCFSFETFVGLMSLSVEKLVEA